MKSSAVFKKYYKDGKLLAGFTLIELIVAMAISLILMFGVSVMLNDIWVNSNQYSLSMNGIDTARLVSSSFINEIRAAAYGSYPLIAARDSSIAFYSPIGATAGNVNMISYYINGDTLYKDVFEPVGSPPAYNLQSHTAVLTGLSNGGAPLFYYYDGSYDGVTNTAPLPQPVYVAQVKFVKINLIVKNQITPHDTSTFSLDVGTAIRVLKNNLSN